MSEKTFTLYLDESGDDMLYPEELLIINPELETHCTLVGVIVGNDRKDLLKEAFKKIKLTLWKSEEIVFHSVEIRAKKGAFAIFLYTPELYEEFKKQLNDITQKINPSIICSSLNKHLWVKKYPQKLHFKDDPYSQAFIYLLERYAHFLNKHEARGKIVLEQRDCRQDAMLKRTYDFIKREGTQYKQADYFRCLSDKLEFKKKRMNVPGLQLADYCCYPFYVNHKFPKRDNLHYEYLEQFIYPGEFGRYGHKKWPV